MSVERGGQTSDTGNQTEQTQNPAATQAEINEFLKDQGYECGAKCCAIMSLDTIMSSALFIIGCVGAAGAFPGSTIGWVTVGLGGGGFALSLAHGNFKKRKYDVIVRAFQTAFLVTVGALGGGAGILSAIQVGWAIVGSILIIGFVLGCFNQMNFAYSNRRIISNS